MSVGETLLAIALYVVAINLAGSLAMAWDKYSARRGLWRVSERTLLTIAAFGGTIGTFIAARHLRHKIQKQPFGTILRAIAVMQLIVLAALFVPQVRDVLWQFL